MTFFSRTALGFVLAISVFGCTEAAESASLELAPETAAQLAATRQIEIPVTLRGSGSATVRAKVYANPTATGDVTILSVPGLAASGAVFQNLNAALFKDPTGAPVAQVVTLDFPGHGDSTTPTGLPSGVKFSDLTIEDNAAVVVQVIRALAAQDLAPALLVGHATGGLAIAAAQESLLASGSSLAELGVRTVLLYAPVPSRGQPWTQPAANPNLPSYITEDPTLGTLYTLPTSVWGRSGFTTTGGTLVEGAPTEDQVKALGYAALEPVAVLNQLTSTPVGGPAIPRPEVRAGAFAQANGTTLIVVSFSENTQVPAADVESFYVHLTGDASKSRLAQVVAPDAVSNMFITNPQAVLDATRKFFAAP